MLSSTPHGLLLQKLVIFPCDIYSHKRNIPHPLPDNYSVIGLVLCKGSSNLIFVKLISYIITIFVLRAILANLTACVDYGSTVILKG